VNVDVVASKRRSEGMPRARATRALPACRVAADVPRVKVP
jgi:hypothetical protein